MSIQKFITRRHFIKGTAAVGAGGLLGCSPTKLSEGGKSTENVASTEGKFNWETAPKPIAPSQINETIDADVVIIGAGTAGVTAALAAAEEGAKVVVLQKGISWMTHGWGIGAINSSYQKNAGYTLSDAEIMEILNEFHRNSCNRPDMNLLKLWAYNSGPVIDWLGAHTESAGNGPSFLDWRHDKTKKHVGDSYYTKEYPLVHMWAPPTLHVGMMEILVEKAKKMGVVFRYQAPAVRLVREKNQGRVTGVISEVKKGYLQANAKKGVIICTGDYGNNPQMIEKYCPTVIGIKNRYMPADNTGDGHLIAMWEGAALERAPAATMVHYKPTIMPEGDTPFDATPWLWVNKLGKRYMNEDTTFGWVYQMDVQQPDSIRYQICDSDYDSQWPYLGDSSFRTDLEKTFGSFEEGLKSGAIFKANTIEELAAKIGAPAAQLKETVDRYNSLCDNGFDADYGKRADYLKHTTIKKAPFYALKREPAVLTVCGGGLDINTNLQVRDTNKNVIEGLYAAGNASGNFFGYDYPLTIPGVSLGRATTFGYLAGKTVAKI